MVIRNDKSVIIEQKSGAYLSNFVRFPGIIAFDMLKFCPQSIDPSSWAGT